MERLYLVLTIMAYGLSLGSYLRYLLTGKEFPGRVASLLLALGLIVHYFALLERSRGLHTVPYHDLYGSMSLFGWLLGVTYLGLEIYHRQRSVGTFVLPFVLVFFLVSHLAPAGRIVETPARGATFAFHVTLSILAYAAFGLSFVLSLIFLAEQRLLRNRDLGAVVWRLPPLELLERMSQSGVIVGLAAIIAGTTLGFLWVDRLQGTVWYFDPKYIVTLLVLVLYAAYLFLARSATWRGARASKLCIFNFALVIFSFTVVNLFLSHNHRYF
ncbi:MAG: cytochrome c biogenesis protein CcsA [Acidobacteria bacterium]|nr:cytochrome c biogenesis protein CcsA [Acidobacteriota bacterium]MBS1867564.1 cytochrome c biogenesis protein CcsA [Acidobacteriota bacterium]